MCHVHIDKPLLESLDQPVASLSSYHLELIALMAVLEAAV